MSRHGLKVWSPDSGGFMETLPLWHATILSDSKQKKNSIRCGNTPHRIPTSCIPEALRSQWNVPINIF